MFLRTILFALSIVFIFSCSNDTKVIDETKTPQKTIVNTPIVHVPETKNDIENIVEDIVLFPEWKELLWNELFVSSTWSDLHNWTSPQQALKSIQTAIEISWEWQKIYVKAWLYQDEKFSITSLHSSNIIIEWYYKVPGDSPLRKNYTYTSEPSSQIMPYIKWSHRSLDKAVFIEGREGIKIKNFQISDFSTAFSITHSSGALLENIIVQDIGDIHKKYDGKGISLYWSNTWALIKDIVIINAAAEWVFISGKNHILDNVKVYADDNSTWIKSATDYYIVLRGAYNSLVQNSYIERIWELAHWWHGFSVKWKNTGNVFQNNTSINMNNGWFVARHRWSTKNIFRNNVINEGNIWLMVRDGASGNLFEKNTVQGVRDAIVLMDTTEDDGKQSWWNENIFSNLEISDTKRYVISFNGNIYNDIASQWNNFLELDINGGKYLIEGGHISRNNTLSNSTIRDVKNYLYLREGIKENDIDFEIVDTNILNGWLTE